MDKGTIIEAYARGLLSKDECTKLLGIDPTILLKDDVPSRCVQQNHKSYSN
ncbi:hypothetical protein [Tepidibacillus fermentans]|uniref:Uncharacterized protein n=1 Tax=Tepidibacillus fermentans TaxID=1281767 RepID=A0A4R3KLC0_9BACI|nr:hypothetical protein [Tepidibacillus fermentans]TCS84146.1 hypothetical protein EDD72_102190 [Tepidibacillus fermentans]